MEVCLRTEFVVKSEVTKARLLLLADFCRTSIFVNGSPVATVPPYDPLIEVDLKDAVKAGSNVVTFCCRSVDGPSAVAAELEVVYPNGSRDSILTDRTWLATEAQGHDVDAPGQGDAGWRPVATFGAVTGSSGYGVSDSVKIGLLDDYSQWERALNTETATSPAGFLVPDGFEVQLLRSAADGEDSWVSMTCDDEGRWIVAKEKKGLLRFTLNAAADRVIKTETINDSLAECRGLLVAHGSLYAMANNDKALYRLRDADGDDRFDEVSRLAEFPGDVGHGRNQITLGPDGMLYVICGDAVYEPEAAEPLVPALRRPNHFERTRSGFVAKTGVDGRHWEIVTRGLRNPFGIDFNDQGDMFTYDADAEYDMGSSWYRPTRVHHLAVGGDYGWRRVTRQWPPYFPDRPDIPQPVLEIGKGSPTAVAFGTKSSFPWPYRDALFALDWAYGRILAVHLSPRGSSYAARAETFLRGSPLNVTDVEFGPDGAMYFVTGGRATQSALYRVSYLGSAPERPKLTDQELARQQHAEQSRKLRRRLESISGTVESGAVDLAWPLLRNADPWIRNAARTVIEWQPVSRWKRRALSAEDIDTAAAGLLALVRVGHLTDWDAVVRRLSEFDLREMTTRQQQEVIFLLERCLEEGVRLSEQQRNQAERQLDAIYPAKSFAVNLRLSLIVARFGSPTYVERTMGLLRQATSPREQFHFLFALRNTTNGWTSELREAYYQYLKQTSEHVGGEGLPRFRQLIESESLATLQPRDRERFSQLLKKNTLDFWQDEYEIEDRQFVRRWTVDDLNDSLASVGRQRDFERGRRMFTVARCIACHRVGNRGGVTGPDLTSVSGRFSRRDLLTSIVEPSKVIAEKYRGVTLVMFDGRVFTGQVLASDYRSGSLTVVTDPLAPDKRTTVQKRDIETQQPSPISPMPQGLLDTLSEGEILDLLAWILAGGRAEHPAFRE